MICLDEGGNADGDLCALRAGCVQGERVVALGLTYVLDRSLTVAFPGLHNGTHTRLRLSPAQVGTDPTLSPYTGVALLHN
jgi:hypothetical protein